MVYGIIRKPISTIYECPSEKMAVNGQTLSAIADEALHGMIVAVTGEMPGVPEAAAAGAGAPGASMPEPVAAEAGAPGVSTPEAAAAGAGAPEASASEPAAAEAGAPGASASEPAAPAVAAPSCGFLPIRTFYGYTGYIPAADIRIVAREQAADWESSELYVVSGICVDVTSLPKVQGVCLISLFRGSLVKVLDWESEKAGWARVQLADGREGYMRNQFLMKKKFSQAGAWQEALPQAAIEDEGAFRRGVMDAARCYLGVQYRWGGKSTAGVDCSGLVSVSYMLNGILIYRDAKILDGYPLHAISREQMKPGDLMFFPGHVAMYLGEGLYIHSTGKIGSGGVVYNSLDPESPLYRRDLAEGITAIGSIF